ncbi:anti-sigma factor [Arthrobacter sp. GMC3]|uniref:anti-sigma factor n=1 Tax=Arthrobacter sp. GMC3 TaxID=2058894 RepID=UPI000CE4FB59|nr:anti-sigma factor [Arthrobacter sp. GMC3]
MEKQLHLLTGAYALNALSDTDRAEFERYALGNPDALEEVRGLSETAALLAFASPAEVPPPEMKAHVMAAIRNTRQLPASSVVRDISSGRKAASRRRPSTQERSRWVPLVSVAAALALFAGVGVGGWVIGQSSSQSDLHQQLSAAQAQQQAMLAIMASPDAKIATTVVPTGGTVTVASSATANQAAVMVKDLPTPPAGKTYELWFISAAGAVPAGLMGDQDPAAPSMQVLKGPMGGATHVGITVEPEGGSPSPTTTPILVQAIQSV